MRIDFFHGGEIISSVIMLTAGKQRQRYSDQGELWGNFHCITIYHLSKEACTFKIQPTARETVDDMRVNFPVDSKFESQISFLHFIHGIIGCARCEGHV